MVNRCVWKCVRTVRRAIVIALIPVVCMAGCGFDDAEDASDVGATVSDVSITDTVAESETGAGTDDADGTESETGAKAEDDSVAVSAEDDSQGEVTSEVSIGNGYVIVLDPGHASVISGETEPVGPGATEMKAKDTIGTTGVSSGVSEYQLNLEVAVQLREELEGRGYTVYLTREDSDTAISCVERAEIANSYEADVFIRIHADGSESQDARGCMTICITPDNPYNPEMYEKSRDLSEALIEAYVAATGLTTSGVWETDSMTGNNWSEVPCTLIELGFMTNPEEDMLMQDSEFRKKMIKGMADGVDSFIDYTYCSD